MKKSITLILLLISSYIPMNSQTVFTHPWQGKRVAYLGDSITDPKNSGSKKKFWGFLNEWLGITPYVYGISGRQWNDIPNQAQKLKKQHGDDVDAILIFVGTNDFNHSIPLGEWFEEKEVQVEAAEGQPKALETRVMRTYKMDKNTYRGRINIAMSLLKKMYPTKQIVLLTPLHRAYACFGEKNVQPSEAYQNKCGEYIDAYIDAVKQAGNLWAVPVIDWNATSGLYPLESEHAIYFANPETDLLHPNDKGQERMARTLYYQLLTLPCTF